MAAVSRSLQQAQEEITNVPIHCRLFRIGSNLVCVCMCVYCSTVRYRVTLSARTGVLQALIEHAEYPHGSKTRTMQISIKCESGI